MVIIVALMKITRMVSGNVLCFRAAFDVRSEVHYDDNRHHYYYRNNNNNNNNKAEICFAEKVHGKFVIVYLG